MELRELKEQKKMKNREDLIFETNKHIYNFQQFEAIRPFAKNILGGKTALNNADEYQSNLLVETMNLKKNTKLKNPEQKKRDTLESSYIQFLKIEKKFLMLLKEKYFHCQQLKVQDVLQTLLGVSNLKS